MHPDHLPTSTGAQRAGRLAVRVLLSPLLRLVWTVLGLVAVQWTLERLVPSIGRLPNVTLAGAAKNALVASVVLWASVRLLEGKGLDRVGLSSKGALQAFASGYLLGALLLGAVMATLFAAGGYRVVGLGAGANARDVGHAALLFFLVGIFEEVLARGILFRLLEQGLGTVVALLASAFLFGFGHSHNPGATTLSSVAIALEAGVLLAAAYVATRSLWLPIGLHAAWDFFEGPVYGAPVSGVALPSVLQARFPGPAWLTGGAFGAEAGLPAIFLGTALGLVFLLLALRRGRLFTPRFLARLLRLHGAGPTSATKAAQPAATPSAPPLA
ncbi:MAG: lysostaphin resistance A-like protein [Myxococcaceae bacterium]